MSQRLSLTALLVRDYDEAIDFYVGKVGFELVEDADQGGGKRWVVVRPPGSDAALLLAKAVGDQAQRIGDQAGGRVFLFLVCAGNPVAFRQLAVLVFIGSAFGT